MIFATFKIPISRSVCRSVASSNFINCDAFCSEFLSKNTLLSAQRCKVQQIPSMSRLDVVIFGATGFTGQNAVEEIARIRQKDKGLTWGVAGRSKDKLEKVVKRASEKTGEDLSKVRIIIADTNDEASIKAMTAQAKVVVNCCGPFRLYGEQIVKACIETKTNHVDVSGEPQFIETMQLKYHKAAEEAGVYIVSACGFDSIPNDMGVVFLEQNFKGTLNSVESHLSMHVPRQYRQQGSASLHYGTWESLVLGLTHWDELVSLRKQLYPDKMPSSKPSLASRPPIHKYGDMWYLPFPGADKSIVYRTQRFFYDKEKKRPVQFKPYIGFPNLMIAGGVLFMAAVMFVMTKFAFTRNLLLKHPKFFSFGLASHEGPTEERMNKTTFKVVLKGEGWDESVKDIETTEPNKVVYAKVFGVNPGYGATVVGLLQSALTILKENDKMPGKGGVLTTGAAFSNTSLIQNLHKNNFTFDIIDKDE